MESIPFLDINTNHAMLEPELMEVFREALRTGRFIGGPMVESFEEDFAKFCDTQYCIGVGSGTDALRFAIIAAGVKNGETVITVPNTFIATTEAISQAGALIDFVDIDEETYNMDMDKLREYLETECTIDDRTGHAIKRETGSVVSAVIPVHLYGQTADMDKIGELADKYKLIVIEDACQAHGAEYFSIRDGRWRRAGSMGKAAAFSFYPGKNLGALGEAGAVTTNDSEVARKIRIIRDHGQEKKYIHEMEGYNGRLDALQAGFLRIKLSRLEEWNEKRRMNARYYDSLLKEIVEVRIPYIPEWARSVYHLYVIRVQNRDRLQRYLGERGIGTGLHYPVPLHLQTPYNGRERGYGRFPVTEAVSREILSLPMYPGLIEEHMGLVVDALMEYRQRDAE